MKRIIYKKLLEWKNTSNGKTALLIDGARRVGKSYIAEEFARNEYEGYLLIDFAKASKDVKGFFMDYLEDLDTFFMYLLGAYHVELKPRKSVIIFDEVQRFPRAREAIKYLVADGRYHYMETGSLISMRKNVKDIVIPSEERHVKMFPMDFEEFLMATGNQATIPLIEMHFSQRKSLGQDTHRRIMDVFRQYMVVGGMPQAVSAFVSTHDLKAVESEKRDILELYRADIGKFAGGMRHKVLSLWDEIPGQLSRHERKFRLSSVGENARMRDYEDAFEWLKEAMTVNIAYNVTDPNVGFKMNEDRTSLKCYMGDTGLLVSHAFSENELASEDIHRRLLVGKIEVNRGMMVENVVAQMLRAAGLELFFHSNSSRDSAQDRMEIDFLMTKSKVARRKNVVPIEVKCGKDYSTVSLEKFCRKFKSYADCPIVFHPLDVKTEKGILYLPLYMAGMIAKADANR